MPAYLFIYLFRRFHIQAIINEVEIELTAFGRDAALSDDPHGHHSHTESHPGTGVLK